MKATPKTLGAAVWLTASLATHGLAQDCIGCVPLNDLGVGTYQGEEGGLYPGGINVPPPAHAAAALRAARSVVPRLADGTPHPDGLIGIASLGVSSHGQVWREVTRRVEADAGYGGHIVMLEGAINGGATALLIDPLNPVWEFVDDRMGVLGLSHEQIQAVFLETSNVESPPLPFPASAHTFRDELGEIARLLFVRYPNLKVVFLSSLIYSRSPESFLQEPRNYEDGFGVKWVVEDQIAGDPGLEYDPRRGTAVAPVLVWGPYHWANGSTPRSDGLTWLPSDFQPDGFHPNLAGELKAADIFEQFVSDSPVADAIFRARAGVTRGSTPITKDAGLDASRPDVALGGELTVDVFQPDLMGLVQADVAPYSGAILHAKLAIEPDGRAGQIVARGVTDTSWSEATVTASSAPAFDGDSSLPLGVTSDGMLAEWDVTQWVRAVAPNAGAAVAFGLFKVSPTLLSQFYSRESGRLGWLAVSIDLAPGGAESFCAALPNSTGVPALLGHLGSVSLASQDLSFLVADAPPMTAVLPFVGTTSAEVALVGGDVCVGGTLARLPLVTTDAAGRASFAVDWTAPGTSVAAGDTRTVQVVFRDLGTGGFRTTSALVVSFRP